MCVTLYMYLHTKPRIEQINLLEERIIAMYFKTTNGNIDLLNEYGLHYES